MQQWKRNYRVLNNQMWMPRSEPWMPRPELPQMWPIVASLVAWMTDQRPTIEAQGTIAPFSDYADFVAQLSQDMTSILSANWTRYNMSAEVSKVLWDVCTNGIGYVKSVWEPWLANGQGDAVMRRVDPYNIYPDPFARNMSELGWIIEARVLPIEDVDRAYPGARNKLSASGYIDADNSPHKLDETVSMTAPRVGKDFNLKSPSLSTTNSYGQKGSGRVTVTESPVVTLLECWVRSHEADKDGNTTEKWSCIVVCGNQVLMQADAFDINSHGGHPYDRMTLFDTGEWYGPSLVELLTPAQESINRILAAIESNLVLVGNPMLVRSNQAAARNRRMTNKPGAILDADPTQVAWMNPPQMHPQIAIQLVQFYKSEMESISGMSAIIRGFTPSGRNSQGVMDSVQDSAFVRVRATLRELEAMLNSAGNKIMATIAEFYTEPRMLGILGPDGERTTKMLRSRHFYLNPDGGKKGGEPLSFVISADAGSQLPTSKGARAADATQMYALGIVDRLEVLKAKQWPNYGTVARRVDQAAASGLMQPPGQRQASRA